MNEKQLFKAIESGDFKKAESIINRSFLRKNFDINATDKSGLTALSLAAANGNKEIVELLLLKGADVRFCFPLTHAITSGKKEIVELLVQKGADVNKKDRSGETPLFDAVKHGYRDIIELLLSKGADPNIRDRYNQTPLAIALEYGSKSISSSYSDNYRKISNVLKSYNAESTHSCSTHLNDKCGCQICGKEYHHFLLTTKATTTDGYKWKEYSCQKCAKQLTIDEKDDPQSLYPYSTFGGTSPYFKDYNK